MSYYDKDPPRRQKTTRDRRRDDYDDGAYADRDNRQTTLVRRQDSNSSVEEVTREFPPGDRGGGYYRETTVRKKGVRPARARSIDDGYYDDRYDDRSYVSGRRGGDYVAAAARPRSRVADRGGRKYKEYRSSL